MSSASRNFISAYALLVVLPLVGLAGILKNGRRLTAPPTIDGLWSVQANDSGPCGNASNSVLQNSISISQSGRSFVLGVPGNPKIAAHGTLDGNNLRASLNASALSGAAVPQGCSARAFTLIAKISRVADSSVLTGSLSAEDCPTCAPVAFRAERQNATASKEVH